MDTLRIRDPLNREVERYALDAVGRATIVWDIENRPMAIRYALGDLVSGIDRFDGGMVNTITVPAGNGRAYVQGGNTGNICE